MSCSSSKRDCHLLLTDTAGGIFFRRDTDGFRKGLEKVAVIIEARLLTGIAHTHAISQQSLGNGNASGSDVFIDRGSCCRFENTTDVRTA